MSEPEQCLLCARIARKEFDSFNEHACSMRPNNLYTPGHFLVVPFTHTPDARANPVITAQAARFAAMAAPHGSVILTQIGATAGQMATHLYLHVIPVRDGDGLNFPWRSVVFASER